MGAVGLLSGADMETMFNFSNNWNNKLYTNFYTTLRMTDRHQVGDKGLITLKQQPQHVGEIIAKNPLKLYAPRNAFLDVIALLDTGYNWDETVNILKKMYSLESTKGKVVYQYVVHNTREAIPEARLL